MATTTCPACGRAVPIPKGHVGGPLTCPNAGCGRTFEPRTPARPAPRPAGAPPELLQVLAPSFATSPALFAIGAVVTLLYGLVLFGVVSSWKKHRLEELAKAPPPEPPMAVASAPSPPAPGPTTDKQAPSPTARADSKATKSSRSEKTASSPTTAASGASSKRAGSPPASRPTRSVTRPTPPVTPAPPPEPRLERWGELSVAGSSPDCGLRLEGNALFVTIPGTLHFLNPMAPPDNREPPRLLTTVTGDFVARVRVAGRIRPGTTPLRDFPFPFQGAGLVLWQDAKNYLRLERSSIYSPEGKRLHQVLLELYRDGRVAATVQRDVSDTDLLLRFDRRGSEVRCAYSPDNGKTWLEIKRQPVTFPARMSVGVSASNASPQVFAPRFEEWDLAGPATGS